MTGVTSGLAGAMHDGTLFTTPADADDNDS